jgi:hypothetical protein
VRGIAIAAFCKLISNPGSGVLATMAAMATFAAMKYHLPDAKTAIPTYIGQNPF